MQRLKQGSAQLKTLDWGQMERSTVRKLLALLAGAGVAATVAWTAAALKATRETAPQDVFVVTELTGKMKNVCAGRFLIDMPELAQIELTRANVNGFDIAAFAESKEEFRQRLATREAQISALPHRTGASGNLESAKVVNTRVGIEGKMFVHSRTVTEGTAANGLELERYRYESVAVEALLHGNGVSIDIVANEYFPDRTENLTR